MNRHPFALLLAAAAVAWSAGSAPALTASTSSLTCSATAKLQDRIDSIPAGSVATILVSGTCNENITVPQGKTIILKGATATSRITAADGMLPALISRGDTTIQKMVVSNATGTAEYLVGAERGGQLNIVSSDLGAPYVGTVVAAWIGSVRAINSRVIGGNDNAFEVSGASSLVVKGDPLMPVGPTGTFEAYVRSKGSGVLCARGASFRIGTGINAGTSGLVTIERSKFGVLSAACDFDFSNPSGVRANIRIRNNGNGIWVNKGSGEIYGASITGNANSGIEVHQAALSINRTDVTASKWGLIAEQSSVTVSGSTFSSTLQDVSSRYMSFVRFTADEGKSSLPKALTWTNSFDCGLDGAIDIDAGALVQSLGTTYSFLNDCLYRH